MKIAYSLLPDRFEDGRHVAFKCGLQNTGWTVVEKNAHKAGEGDLVLGWNAYGATYDQMALAEKHGATALVFEEGYVRNIKGEKYFACAKHGHNGFGKWNIGGPDRWDGWGIDINPWRREGNHILVCGQRGFGYNEMAMPNDWQDVVLPKLRALTDRPIWFRPHPKRRAVMPTVKYDRVVDFNEPLSTHLANAWAVVVWTSNSATEALLTGIPALFDGPAIVTEPVTTKGIILVADPPLTDRNWAMINMSWAQWSVAEFTSGEAFDWLLK